MDVISWEKSLEPLRHPQINCLLSARHPRRHFRPLVVTLNVVRTIKLELDDELPIRTPLPLSNTIMIVPYKRLETLFLLDTTLGFSSLLLCPHLGKMISAVPNVHKVHSEVWIIFIFDQLTDILDSPFQSTFKSTSE